MTNVATPTTSRNATTNTELPASGELPADEPIPYDLAPPLRATNANGMRVQSDAQIASERIALRVESTLSIQPIAMSVGELLCLALGQQERPQVFGSSALALLADDLHLLWCAFAAEERPSDATMCRMLANIERRARASAEIAERFEQMRSIHDREGA